MVSLGNSMWAVLRLARSQLNTVAGIMNMDGLIIDETRKLRRVQITKVTRLLREYRTFWNTLHDEGVVFAKKQPSEIVGHCRRVLQI
jgi:hypothetical protein